jgi:hypothetical protein
MNFPDENSEEPGGNYRSGEGELDVDSILGVTVFMVENIKYYALNGKYEQAKCGKRA